MKTVSKGFIPRAEFPPHNVPLANFAAHHRRALADLRFLSGQVNLVLDLRDSRAPVSSINPLIQQALPGIPKLTLYTKWDKSLLKPTHVQPLHPDNMFRMISTENRKFGSRLRKEMIAMAGSLSPPPPLGFKVLITGMPNAGKSTLINELHRIYAGNRSKKVVKTGSNPGITRSVSEQILLNEKPRLYVLDTPGVLMPQVHDWEQMLKLCLIGAIPRNLVDPVVLADYLLYQVNKCYPNGGRYPGPLSNDIDTVLWNLAQTNRRFPSKENWDPNHTASEWVDRFVRGGIGKINLDDMSIDKMEYVIQREQAQQFDLNSLLPPGTSPLSKRRSRRL